MRRRLRGIKTVGIEEARENISKMAWNAWVMLHMVTPEELAEGRRALAKRLGWSEARFNELLHELKVAGYVELRPADQLFKPTRIVLKLQAKLPVKNKFLAVRRLPVIEERQLAEDNSEQAGSPGEDNGQEE